MRVSQISGLSEVQVLILQEIKAHITINSTNLNKIIRLSQYRINVQVDCLIHKKLIEKTKDDIDKRDWNLMLSTKALNLLESSCLIKQKLALSFSHLPSSQQTQIRDSLEYLAALIEF